VSPGSAPNRPADGHYLGLQVHVTPLQPKCLALPQAEGQRNQPPNAIAVVAFSHLDYGGNLGGGQRLNLTLGGVMNGPVTLAG